MIKLYDIEINDGFCEFQALPDVDRDLITDLAPCHLQMSKSSSSPGPRTLKTPTWSPMPGLNISS